LYLGRAIRNQIAGNNVMNSCDVTGAPGPLKSGQNRQCKKANAGQFGRWQRGFVWVKRL